MFPSNQQRRVSLPVFLLPKRLPVLYVWHVDGTPATSKLQADVKVEGLAAPGATVGCGHKVHSHFSHLPVIIMMHA